MKKSIAAFCILVICKTFAQDNYNVEYRATVETIFLDSKAFSKERELQVFLPDEYFSRPNDNFKVLYLFDAQNQRIFNHVKGIVEHLSMLQIEPMIIVGIVTEDRWNEFLTPNNHAETLKKYQPPMGNARVLLSHIENEVEPFIKGKYRTQEYRLAIGHSLGATFATYASMESNSLFDYTIAISPNFYYDKEQFVQRAEKFGKSELHKTKKFYFTIGGKDTLEQQFSRSLQKVLEIFDKQPNQKIKWSYVSLGVDSHSLTWFEGVYKGLLNGKEDYPYKSH